MSLSWWIIDVSRLKPIHPARKIVISIAFPIFFILVRSSNKLRLSEPKGFTYQKKKKKNPRVLGNSKIIIQKKSKYNYIKKAKQYDPQLKSTEKVKTKYDQFIARKAFFQIKFH